jgi:CO/xanthine dehydrogenase Mo-binding subunit
MTAHAVLGKSIARVDGREKVTGQTRYTGDLQLPGMLYAKLVLSLHAHARITRIDKAEALRVPGVVDVVTGEDVLEVAPNARESMLLALGATVYYGHPVAAVLGETEAAAEEGAAAVVVEYEELPAALEALAAMEPGAPRVNESDEEEDDSLAQMHATVGGGPEQPQRDLPANVTTAPIFQRGDVEAGFQAADHIVERTYRTSRVHQSYLETQAAVAAIDPLGRLQIFCSTQSMFTVRSSTAKALGIPETELKVTAMPIGGGFGAKFLHLEPLAGALALRTRRSVRLVLPRMDDYLSTTPAPESIIELKTGCTNDGRITAIKARVIFDSGAFGGSPMNVACLLLGGYYRCENLYVEGYEVLTHKPQNGAYRAPGAPQGTFAIESNVAQMAAAVGMDPIEFRLKNCAVEGDPLPNGDPWPSIGLQECLERLRDHPAYREWRSNGDGEGVGVAVGGWLMGVEPSAATCRLNSDGTLSVLLGSVDLTGTNTGFTQIAAEAFGVPLEKVRVISGDSDAAPYAGGAGGSKITYTVGPAVQQAAEDARNQVLAIAADMLEAAVEDLEIVDNEVRVKGVPDQKKSIAEVAGAAMRFGGMYKPVQGRGQTAITQRAPGFAAHLVRAQVDPDTGEARLTGYVAVQDVGFAINPAEVTGQIRGGVAQGIGWAMLEAMVYDETGQLVNPSLMDYALPNAVNVPDIEVVMVEKPSEFGPFGAKGVGEPPVIPGAAAIANAIEEAIGARVTHLPITPQRLVAAMQGNGARG